MSTPAAPVSWTASHRGRRWLRAALAGGALVLAATATATVASASASAGVQRVVALSPFTANTAVQLGVKPVAIGERTSADEYLPALNGVTQLTLSHPDGPNLEQLALLNPQLVLSAPVWDAGESAIRQLGVKVVDATPQRLSQVSADIQQIGQLLDRHSQAAALAARVSASLSAARRGVRRHPSVLVVLGVGRVPYAFLANSWGGDIVTAAGGRLVTGGLSASGGFAPISDESVLVANPQVIIVVPHGNPGDINGIVHYYEHSSAWAGTSAAIHHRIYISTDDSLLQAQASIATTIDTVERSYLHDR